ncbi:MAG: histidine phosphatase family protein [Candidatus Kerfeldbacteria bacterium]
MVSIIFESHGTSLDNEAELSSGRFDVELSDLGIQQARGLGERYRWQLPDIVYCSDLKRSYETAELAFGSGVRIVKDPRLTECDYGDLTRHTEQEVKSQRGAHVITPFPNGESYRQCAKRMKDFLRDCIRQHDGQTVMIIGHRATQYGLEHWINGVPLEEAVTAPWQWQPGWVYNLTADATH